MRKIVCLLLMLVLICNVGALSVSADTFGVNIKVCREHGVYIEAKCPKCTKKKNEKNSSGSTSGSIGTGIHSRNDDLPKASDTWDHKDEAEFPWWLITGGHRAEDGLIPIFVCSNGSGPVLPY